MTLLSEKETLESLHLEIDRLRSELKRKNEIVELDKEISEILYQLRVPASVKGFNLLKEAIKNLYIDHTTIDLYTTLIYKELAEKFNGTSSQIERAIRHAIESGWNKNSKSFQLLNKYLEEKPTNSEFLALMVNYLRMKNL
jgi:two-component system, response regulator, stage 0 sporulation protein A